MTWKIERLEALYKERIGTVESALRQIKPGQRIFVGTGCAEPQHLVQSLARFPQCIADTEILHMVSVGPSPVMDPCFTDMFRLNTFFIGKAAREAVARGDADYTPMFLSEIPRLITSGRLKIDVALVQVTPPDGYGNCSLGVSVEAVKAAVEHAGLVIAQVNPRMPYTHGDSFVSVERLHVIVEHEEPILEAPPVPIDEILDRIGYYVSRLVPNGATIQAGIGGIPNAVLRHLMDKRDLGVHTEMFSDGLIDLYEAGVLTGARKTFHPGKVVAAFCMGSQRLYDTIDGNPSFEFHPTDYVSDPRNISRNQDMVAINSALEIDLTGQICADSLGHHFFSGIGGQADFIRGAALAPGGRPIIALPSTARKGAVSRIVASLSEGAGVVTTRGDVHYVVTEYGIAYLHGKTIRERALALINVAHPRFRAGLLDEAKRFHYVYQDQQLPPEGGSLYPERARWQHALSDGREVQVRPIKPIDEGLLRRFFYGLRDTDVYYRFMGAVRTLPHDKAQPLVTLDYQEKFAIAACVGEEDLDETFVAVARWFLDRTTNMAEVAFTVSPDWQGHGLGSFLLRCLVEVARQHRISGFTAEVLSGNRKMLGVFTRSGFPLETRMEDGVTSLSFRID